MRKLFGVLFLLLSFVTLIASAKPKCNPFMVPWEADVYVKWISFPPEGGVVNVTLYSQQYLVPVASKRIWWRDLPAPMQVGSYKAHKITFTAEGDGLYLNCTDGLVAEVTCHGYYDSWSADFIYQPSVQGILAQLIYLDVTEINPLDDR